VSRIRIAVAAVCLLISGASMAQTPSGQSNDKKQAIVQQLIAITGLSKLGDQIVTMVLPQSLNAVKRANPRITDEDLAELRRVGLEEFRAAMPQFMEGVGKIYEGAFSQQELEALLAFYKSPLGQKVIETMPTLLQQSHALGIAWGMQVGKRMKERIDEEARRRGYAL